MLDNKNNDTTFKIKNTVKLILHHLYIYMVLFKVMDLVGVKKIEVKEITNDFFTVVENILVIIHKLTKLIVVVKTETIRFHQIDNFSQYHPFTVNKRIPFEMVWMSDG